MNMRLKLVKYFITIFIWVLIQNSYSITLRVPSQYLTIQEGINAATDGDTVLVAPGIYTGPNNTAISFLGKRIVVTSETGFMETTIDCQGVGRGFSFVSDEDSMSILDGFTIINGVVEDVGGGILCSSSSPTIRNNNITVCEAYWGGGIGCVTASPLIINNSVVANHGERGGGIALLDSSNAVVRNNIISENIASGG
jgi:hypothetical protein